MSDTTRTRALFALAAVCLLTALVGTDVLALKLIHAALVCASPLFGLDLARAVLPAMQRQVDRARALRGAPPRYSR